MSKKVIAAMASGGLDSCVLVDWLAERYQLVLPVYVSCGLAWEAGEREALERFVEALERPNIESTVSLSVDMRDVYSEEWFMTGENVPGAEDPREAISIPGRNLVLLGKTAVFCALREIPSLALGFIQAREADHADATEDFFHRYEGLIEQGLGFPLRILAPFREMPKTDVIRMGQHLPLELSLSCFNPYQGKHCGECYSCARRREAFVAASVADCTVYHN